MSTPQQNPDDPHWLRSNKAKLAILLAVVGAAATFFFTQLGGLLKPDAEVDAKPSASVASPASPIPDTPEPSASQEPTETTGPPEPSDSPPGGSGSDDQSDVAGLDGPDGPTRFLKDMRPVERGVYEGTAGIAGTTYTSSIWKDVGPSSSLSSVYVVYALDGEWSKFIADVGPTSLSRSDAVMDFEVYVDDRKVGQTYRTTVTESAHVEVNVTGGVQLRLVALHVSGTRRGAYTGQAAWGSARLEK